MLRLFYCSTRCIVWLTTAFPFTSQGEPVTELLLLHFIPFHSFALVWFNDIIFIHNDQSLIHSTYTAFMMFWTYMLDHNSSSLLGCSVKMFVCVEPGSQRACFSSCAHLQAPSCQLPFKMSAWASPFSSTGMNWHYSWQRVEHCTLMQYELINNYPKFKKKNGTNLQKNAMTGNVLMP